METVSNKIAMDATEQNYSNKHEVFLRRLYERPNDAEVYKTLPLGENTRAAIYVRAKVLEAVEMLFDIHKLLYHDLEDKDCDRISDAVREIENISESYIMESIRENLYLHEDEI